MNGFDRAIRGLLAGTAVALVLGVAACADLGRAGYDAGGNPLIQNGVMDQRRGESPSGR